MGSDDDIRHEQARLNEKSLRMRMKNHSVYELWELAKSTTFPDWAKALNSSSHVGAELREKIQQLEDEYNELEAEISYLRAQETGLIKRITPLGGQKAPSQPTSPQEGR